MATQQGEVKGIAYPWGGLRSRTTDWSRKRFVPIIQIGRERDPDLSDVELLMDAVQGDQDKAASRIVSNGPEIGLSLAVPPGVLGDRLAALRNAMASAVCDEMKSTSS